MNECINYIPPVTVQQGWSTCKGDSLSARRLQPSGRHPALIGPQFWSDDGHLLASYSRETGPLVGAGGGGSIRAPGVDVGSGTRSAQQMVHEAWCSSLSHGQSDCAGAPVLCGCDADGAVDARVRQGPLRLRRDPGAASYWIDQNTAGART